MGDGHTRIDAYNQMRDKDDDDDDDDDVQGGLDCKRPRRIGWFHQVRFGIDCIREHMHIIIMAHGKSITTTFPPPCPSSTG